MRLSSSVNAFVLTMAVTSGSTITPTAGFQQRAASSSSSSSPRSCVGSSIRVSATASEATAATATPPASSLDAAAAAAPMTYADVNGLAFRALQRECKALGLSAIGTTAALRGRLLGHFGLERGEVDVVAPVMTAAEIEVSWSTFPPSSCGVSCARRFDFLAFRRMELSRPNVNYRHLTHRYRVVAFAPIPLSSPSTKPTPNRRK